MENITIEQAKQLKDIGINQDSSTVVDDLSLFSVTEMGRKLMKADIGFMLLSANFGEQKVWELRVDRKYVFNDINVPNMFFNALVFLKGKKEFSKKLV